MVLHHCSPNATDLCRWNFQLKLCALLFPPLQLAGTRERLAALRPPKHKRRTCKVGRSKLYKQSPASREAFQQVLRLKTSRTAWCTTSKRNAVNQNYHWCSRKHLFFSIQNQNRNQNRLYCPNECLPNREFNSGLAPFSLLTYKTKQNKNGPQLLPFPWSVIKKIKQSKKDFGNYWQLFQSLC